MEQSARPPKEIRADSGGEVPVLDGGPGFVLRGLDLLRVPPEEAGVRGARTKGVVGKMPLTCPPRCLPLELGLHSA